MPIYGKKSIARARKTTRQKRLQPSDTQTIIQRAVDWKDGKKRRIRTIIGNRGWGDENTSLTYVEGKLGPIKEFVKEVLRRKKSPLIVDWGCGTGRAITELQKEFPQAKYFGYSNKFYPEWEHVKEVPIIHEPAEEFLRFFKDGTIDLIYSNLGLTHLYFGNNDRQAGHPRKKAHFEKLFKKLAIGGRLVSNHMTTPASIFIPEFGKKYGNLGRGGEKIVEEFSLGEQKYRLEFKRGFSVLTVTRLS